MRPKAEYRARRCDDGSAQSESLALVRAERPRGVGRVDSCAEASSAKTRRDGAPSRPSPFTLSHLRPRVSPHSSARRGCRSRRPARSVLQADRPLVGAGDRSDVARPRQQSSAPPAGRCSGAFGHSDWSIISSIGGPPDVFAEDPALRTPSPGPPPACVQSCWRRASSRK